MEFDIRQYYEVFGTLFVLTLIPFGVWAFAKRWSRRIEDWTPSKEDKTS